MLRRAFSQYGRKKTENRKRFFVGRLSLLCPGCAAQDSRHVWTNAGWLPVDRNKFYSDTFRNRKFFLAHTHTHTQIKRSGRPGPRLAHVAPGKNKASFSMCLFQCLRCTDIDKDHTGRNRVPCLQFILNNYNIKNINTT